MFGKCDTNCKDSFELVLKFIFVAVFTYGVMSAVCCMKSCSGVSSCCKNATQTVAKCATGCQKACCAK